MIKSPTKMDLFKRPLDQFDASNWDKVFKNGPSQICGRQPLENLKRYGLSPQILLGPFLTLYFKIELLKKLAIGENPYNTLEGEVSIYCS